MLIGIIALASGAQGSEDIKGGVVGGIIGFIVMFGVPGIVFLVLAWKLKKRLGDKALLLEEGTKIYDVREAAAREKERKEAELKASFTPDFEADKEFKGAKSVVWINTLSKQIQFGLPSGVISKEKDKKKMLAALFNSFVTEMIAKTKVLNLDNLTDVDLVHDSETVTNSYYDGFGHGSNYAQGSSLKVESKTTAFHYYQAEFKFNDLDNPIVYIYFNNDRKTAELLCQTVKLLTGKQ